LLPLCSLIDTGHRWLNGFVDLFSVVKNHLQQVVDILVILLLWQLRGHRVYAFIVLCFWTVSNSSLMALRIHDLLDSIFHLLVLFLLFHLQVIVWVAQSINALELDDALLGNDFFAEFFIKFITAVADIYHPEFIVDAAQLIAFTSI
jgi:hypothetical protein